MAYEEYPKPDASHSGCKVGWLYYKDHKVAKTAAAIASRNGDRLAAEGYDFGFQCPGALTGPNKDGMYCVVIP